MSSKCGLSSIFLVYFYLMETFIGIESCIVRHSRELGEDVIHTRDRILICFEDSVDLSVIDAKPVFAFLSYQNRWPSPGRV